MDSLKVKEKITQYFEKSVSISGNFDSGDPSMKEAFVKDALENKIAKEIFELIKKYHPNIKNLKILDLGCGLGGLVAICQENGIETQGVELDPTAAEIAKLRVKQSENILLGDAENLVFSDNLFDVVTSICVIEHVKNPDKYLSEAYRILKTGGRFIIFAPNNLFPWEGHYKSFWLPFLLPYTKNIFKFYLKLKKRAPQFIDFVNLKITPGFLKKELIKAGFSKIQDLSVQRFKERLEKPELIADPKAKKTLNSIKKWKLTEIIFKFFMPFLKISKLYHPIILVAEK